MEAKNKQSQKLEVWLRGPLSKVPPLLQPVAHALLQAREEINELLNHFPDTLLWERPANVASVGFHLQHLSGVLERLFTYARGEALNTAQLEYLANEGKPYDSHTNVAMLINAFNKQVDNALAQLYITEEKELTEERLVGRSKIPSTLLGLLFHAAEHTQRHLGQLLVTARILLNAANTTTK